jgi:hypothetical protein
MSVVGEMLDNPSYIGKVRHKGAVYDGQHPAIIEVETYEQVQQLRTARRTSPSKGVGRRPRGSHLFVHGVLRCGSCGSRMAPRTEGSIEVYRCWRSMNYGDCPTPVISRKRIDEQVLATVEMVLLDSDATLDGLREEGDRRTAETRALAEGAEREAALAQERLARVRRAFQDGKIEPED